MSRSTKLPIIKDRPRNYKKSSIYWRTIRRCQKQDLIKNKDIRNPKEIISDYNYSDYTIDYHFQSRKIKFWLNGYELKNNIHAIKAKRK